MKHLDHRRQSDAVRKFEEELEAKIIGQSKALKEIVNSFSRLTSGIRNPERPLLTLLFMGPTGVGKTETVKILAKTLFGTKKAVTRVNCQEFASPHQVAKLLGSPPGYVGSDIEPILSQNNIDKHHKDAYEKKHGVFHKEKGYVERFFPNEKEHYLSIILFDEIEKADPVLWNSILGILEDGHLTLGNNTEVDFTRSIIVLTSNVGSVEMSNLLKGQMGFTAHDSLDKDIEQEALKAARAIFPYEFLNRFDSMVVFQSLKKPDLYKILDIYISDLHSRVVETTNPFILECTPRVKQFLVDEGTDARFGARPLRRIFEKFIVNPLSNLISTNQVRAGDLITASFEHGKVAFLREAKSKEGILVAK